MRRQLEGVNRCLMHFQHWPPEGSLYILSAYPVQGTLGGEFVTTPRFPMGTIKQRDTPYRSHTLVDHTEGHALQVPHILWTAQCYHCLLLYLCSTVSQCFQKPPPRSIHAETHQISLKMSIDVSYSTSPSPSHDPHHHLMTPITIS